jgi:hypothetical protein
MKYPSWRYHSSGESKIVENEEEHDALGEGWADTPAAHLPPADPDPLPADDPLTPPGETPPADPETTDDPDESTPEDNPDSTKAKPARRPRNRR